MPNNNQPILSNIGGAIPKLNTPQPKANTPSNTFGGGSFGDSGASVGGTGNAVPNNQANNTSGDGSAPVAPVPSQPVQRKQPVVLRNENGNISGVTMPDGRTYLGLSPEDVNTIVGAENRKWATPQGAIEANQQDQTQPPSQDVMSQDNAAIEQQSGYSVPSEEAASPQLSTSERVQAAKTAAGYAAGGAAAGSFIPVVGTALGGALGFAIGYSKTTFDKLQEDRSAAATSGYNNFKFAKSMNTKIMNDVNGKHLSREDAIDAYARNLQNVKTARSTLYLESKKLSGTDLAKVQGEIINIDTYLAYENERRTAFLIALQQPNPLNIQPLVEDSTA